MKTFKDLEFKDHPCKSESTIFGTFGERARIDFENGYGVSVVTGGTGVYADTRHPYEVAVMDNGVLTYDTHITDDVIGHCTQKDVTKIMRQVQEL